MVRLLLLIQVPDAGYQGGMAAGLCPIDCLMLRLEGGKHVIRMIFNNVIIDMSPLGPAPGSALTRPHEPVRPLRSPARDRPCRVDERDPRPSGRHRRARRD